MRATVVALVLLGLVCLGLAAVLASGTGQVGPATVTATGVIRSLADGSHHAVVEVSPPGRPSFAFPAETQEGLSPGQRVAVRYAPDAPDAPVATAKVAMRAGGRGPAWALAALGVLLLLAAMASPVMVRRFPDVLATRVRP